MIELRAAGAVQVLTFSSGPVNALDVEFVNELTEAIRELQRSGAGALVITGAGRALAQVLTSSAWWRAGPITPIG